MLKYKNPNKKGIKIMEKMNQRDFMNVMMILTRMDARCKCFQLKSIDESFIDTKSADGTKEYEPVCIDDLYYNYSTGRIDTSHAADEVIKRITNSKEKQEAHKDAAEPAIADIPTEQIMDIFKKICKDANDDIPDEAEESEKPASAVKFAIPRPVPTAQKVSSNKPKQDTSYDSMLSALDDEEESAEEESREHSETASDNNTKDDSDEAGDSNMRQPEFDEEKTEDSVKKLSGLRSGTGSLMGVMSEVFSLPEAGSAEAAAAAKAEEDKFEI